MSLIGTEPIHRSSDRLPDPEHVLVMDSGKTALTLSEKLLEKQCAATLTQNPDHALRVLQELAPAHVLLNIDEASSGVLRLLDQAWRRGAHVVVVGPGNAMQLKRQVQAWDGVDFVARPVDENILWESLGQAKPARGSTDGKVRVRKVQESIEKVGMLVGRSDSMKQVVRQIQRVAPTTATILITGESGTGKEVVAQAIHRQSTRSQQPFLPINCGAISPQLIESELFGHEKGSFTGAVKEHRGVFERADGGTLFLDEITEMPVDLQVKLLRVLETHKFVRLGSDREQKTDVRIIAATNRCPETEVEKGKLRADLLYRIQVFPIWLPPLRERDGDLEMLAEHFLHELNKEYSCSKTITAEALSALREYSWPGNLRELKNVIERAYIMTDEAITAQSLPEIVLKPAQPVRHRGPSLTVNVGTSVAEVEKNLIYATLDQCGGKKEKAAGILGVSVKTLYNRLREYEEKALSDAATNSDKV